MKKVKKSTPKKQAKGKKALERDSQVESERLIRMLENAPAFICSLRGPTHVFELANAQYYQLVGHRNIVGKPVSAAIPEAKKQGFIDLLDGVLHSQEPFIGNEMQIFLQRTKGAPLELRYVNFVYQPIIEKGKSTGIFVHGVDVTEQVLARKKVEDLAEQVEQTVKTFDTVLTSMKDHIYTFDTQGRFSYANKPLLDLLGISQEEIVGKNFHELPYPAELAETLQAYIDYVVQTGLPIVDETPYTSPTGVLGHYEYIFVPVFDEQGSVGSVAGSTRVITERKETEASLKESEARLRFMADSMPQQVWTANPDGLLDYVNLITVNYFTKTPEEIVGAGWQSVVHPEDLPECVSAWTKSLKTGEQYQVFFRLRRHDGMYRWHLGRATPLMDGNTIVKWFGTNTDIDDQKKLEAQKDDFIAIASHELKTPVTSIKAYCQVLEAVFERRGDLVAAEQLHKMDAQINRLNNLIVNLLDVTKIQSGRMEFHQDYFSLNTLLKETVEEMQRMTDRHTIQLKLIETKRLFGDRERIGQVLTNLITNAVKYSPKAHKVVVSTRLSKGAVVVSVRDFGIGIPKEKQKHVFEQFFRVTGPNQDTYPGLGLGLYIASQIVKREGGTIWVKSEKGKGSTFNFSLPLTKAGKAGKIS